MAKTLNKKPLASHSRQTHDSDGSDFRWFECRAAESKPPDARLKLSTLPGLSPPDSDCGTKRSTARTGGRRSAAHAQRSEVQRSEPDGVRPAKQIGFHQRSRTPVHPVILGSFGKIPVWRKQRSKASWNPRCVCLPVCSLLYLIPSWVAG